MARTLIRPAARADLPRLTAIYNHYVLTSPATFDLEPLTVEQRAAWFLEHANAGRHRLLVADENGLVVGYASTSRFRDRAAYNTTVEASVYCAPEAIGAVSGPHSIVSYLPHLRRKTSIASSRGLRCRIMHRLRYIVHLASYR